MNISGDTKLQKWHSLLIYCLLLVVLSILSCTHHDKIVHYTFFFCVVVVLAYSGKFTSHSFIFNWCMTLLFSRLTPPYMLVLMVYVSLFPYTGSGPQWKKDGNEYNYCKTSWYYNLLYINNFFDKQEDSVCLTVHRSFYYNIGTMAQVDRVFNKIVSQVHRCPIRTIIQWTVKMGSKSLIWY